VVAGASLLSDGARVRVVHGGDASRGRRRTEMFGFLPALAVRRPVFTTMMVALCVVMGAFSFLRLQTDLFPDVEFPVITVTTVYPGAGPEEIETQVTDRLEEAVSTLANLDELRSFSQQNVSILIIQFDLGVDQDQAAIDVRDRIETVRAEMPPASRRRSCRSSRSARCRSSSSRWPDRRGRSALRAGRRGSARPLLARPGRRRHRHRRRPRARGRGARAPRAAPRVRPHAHRRGALIGAENVSVPGGRITEPGLDVPVRVVGEYQAVGELEDLRLPLATAARRGWPTSPTSATASKT
jgi:hydrophobic/amphiphilic exporter-1 (mainly G- bacteria), HAE1 family